MEMFYSGLKTGRQSDKKQTKEFINGQFLDWKEADLGLVLILANFMLDR